MYCKRVNVLWVLFAVFFAMVILAPAKSADHLTAADKEAIAWFDTLGFPDFSRTRLVSVTTGERSRLDEDAPENRRVLAVLLSEKDDQFTVFTFDLFTRSFKKTPVGSANCRTADYENRDIEAEAALRLKQLTAPKSEEQDVWRRFGERLSQRAEIFVLARACAAQGYDKLAHELIEAIAQDDEWRRDGIGRRGPFKGPGRKGLVAALSRDISHSMMWRAILDFGTPSISRKELLAKFRSFVKRFPDSKHAERAKSIAQLLEKMVKEDDEHAKQKRKPEEKMTTEERVAELIHQLRNQNGHQWSQPGACDIFADPRGDKSPASQLVGIGLEAVPQLIEVVDDKRLTRSVGYHRDFYFSHHVLRVGDCAVAIVSRIAGRGFYPRTYTNAAMIKDGEETAVKREIKHWWAAVERKGEKQVLIEATELGNRNSIYQGRQLLKKYPEAAASPIIKAVRMSQNRYVRPELVELACVLKSKEAMQLLLEEVKKGPWLLGRVNAAQGLRQRKRPEGVRAMIEEWEQFTPEGKRVDFTSPEAGIEQLIVFLANGEKLEAIEALAKSFRRHPVDRRLSIISALGKSRGGYSAFSVGPGLGLNTSGEAKDVPREVLDAIEKLLIDALDDTEEREGMSGSWGGKSVVDPRICDIAGHVLTQRFPAKYKFDLSGTLRERDRQRVTLKNTWRKEHDLKPLPLPRTRTVDRLAKEKIDPLLKRIVEAPTNAKRRKAVAEVRTLGLAALPAIREALAGLPTDHVAYKDLSALASRIANTVVEIAVSPESVKLNQPLQDRLQRLRGKPLTSRAFIGLLVDVARKLPERATGVKLTAVRNADHTGVALKVVFTKQRTHQEGSQKGWRTHERVTVGGKCLHSSSGCCSYDHGQSKDAYDDLAATIDKALAAPAGQEVVIRVSLIEEE